MKKLILLRGVPGCGKSTLIKKLELENNTLSTDNIRLMISGIEQLSDGSFGIIQKDNNIVFSLLYRMLDIRMSNGLLTIIDATNLGLNNIQKFLEYSKKYGYELIVCDFNVDLKTLKLRNEERKKVQNGYKAVPDYVVEKLYVQKNKEKLPGYIKKITPEQLSLEIKQRYIPLDKYKNVIHIGDIHGCCSVLKEALPKLSSKNFYIFHGDYFDRGLENADVFRYLQKISGNKNVVFIKGNHEMKLLRFLNGDDIKSDVFNKTIEDFKEAGITKKELSNFVNKLVSSFTYSFHGKNCICSHGGISSSKDLNIMSESNFIYGVGNYEVDIDKIFNYDNFYQVHGHRNNLNIEVDKYSSSFNLEGAVEKGGSLRLLEVSIDGFKAYYFQNTVFDTIYSKENNKNCDKVS